MKEVTATEAKAQLPSLLDEVELGEEITITRTENRRQTGSCPPARRIPGELAAIATSNATDEELFSTGQIWEMS